MRYMDFGFIVEWWWFFTDTCANCAKVVPYLRLCSMPICANIVGIVPEPSTPSVDTPPRPPPSRPLPICSTPTASTMSYTPALMVIHASRNAVAPVAQALATLTTGMPVWPISASMRWPTMPPASPRLPQYSACMSLMVRPQSSSAISAASAAREGTVRSG